MKVLITGAKGLLGSAVESVFRRDATMDVIGLDYKALDITDLEKVTSHFNASQPDLVINCAAYTKVDDCEANEQIACRINGEGAGHVAKAAAACDARLIHISTDYVFKGDAATPYTVEHPTTEPGELSAYGRSKLQGENLVRQYHSGAVIVRTAWLYGHTGPCFPQAILARAEKKLPLRVVTDQVGSPTYAPDLARALLNLSKLEASGLFHVTNAGQCNWHEFAGRIVALAGLDTVIQPITSSDLARPAKRPAYSILDNSRYEKMAHTSMRPWQESLRDYLELRKKQNSGKNVVC